jgi:hypothetical protein
VTVSWLAVAMASGAADFSDDRRSLGLGTVYLFLLVAGLFNVVIVDSGQGRARAAVLYLAAVALHWMTGVEQAAEAFDPESHRARGRLLLAGDGATLAILLFLGARAQQLALGATGPEVLWGQLGWSALLAFAAAIHLFRRRASAAAGWPLLAAVAAGSVIGVVSAAPFGLAWPHRELGLPLLAVLARAAAEELAIRGILQGALATRWPRALTATAAVSALVALAASSRPLGAAALAAAVAPAASRAFTRRLPAALSTRLALELLLF